MANKCSFNIESLRTYVSNFTVEDLKDWFMVDGKKWKLIGRKSNRKSPKVVGVFNLMDKMGMSTLKTLVDEIIEHRRLTSRGIIRKKSKAKAKAKGKANKHEFALGGPFGPTPPITHPMPNTGLQPQLYKQHLPTPTTITPQLTQQVAQPVAAQPVAAQPVAATGAGKFKSPEQKLNLRSLNQLKKKKKKQV